MKTGELHITPRVKRIRADAHIDNLRNRVVTCSKPRSHGYIEQPDSQDWNWKRLMAT